MQQTTIDDITFNNLKGYNGNVQLKRAGVDIEWTPEMVKEFARCAKDPIYFSEKYIKIVHVDRGLIPITMYDYQKEIVNKVMNYRRTAVVTSRQAGKCVCINTPITLRNKKTGETVTMSIGEFYEMQKTNFENGNNQTEV